MEEMTGKQYDEHQRKIRELDEQLRKIKEKMKKANGKM